jgi:UDP-N-acetylglucosamine acyltransferase
MAYCHVAHDCVVGNNVILVNGATLAGEVVVDDYAILSANTLVHQFCHIGAHTMFAGNSLVGKDVPPYIRAARNPLAYSGVNSIGLRRRGFTNEMINNIQDVYRVLYNKGMNVSQALEYIENELPATKERDEIVLFLRNSNRGIIRGTGEKE